MKTTLQIVSSSALAFILLVKTSQTSHDGNLAKMTPKAVVIVLFWALTLHIVFMAVNGVVVNLLRLPTDQKKCIVLLCSQKTLSQAVVTMMYLPKEIGKTWFQSVLEVSKIFRHLKKDSLGNAFSLVENVRPD